MCNQHTVWSFKYNTKTSCTFSLGTTRIEANPCTATAITASEVSSNAHRKRNRTPALSRTDSKSSLR